MKKKKKKSKNKERDSFFLSFVLHQLLMLLLSLPFELLVFVSILFEVSRYVLSFESDRDSGVLSPLGRTTEPGTAVKR